MAEVFPNKNIIFRPDSFPCIPAPIQRVSVPYFIIFTVISPVHSVVFA